MLRGSSTRRARCGRLRQKIRRRSDRAIASPSSAWRVCAFVSAPPRGDDARGPGPESRVGDTVRFRIETSSPEQTEAVGRRLGGLLRAGAVIALSGDLGAGKTVLARGIAAGVAGAAHVSNTPFTDLLRHYRPSTTDST